MKMESPYRTPHVAPERDPWSIDELKRMSVMTNPRFSLPNWPRWKAIRLRDVVTACDDSLAIIFYGSSIRIPRKTQKKFLFWKYWSKEELKQANDVDVMAIGPSGTKMDRISADVEVRNYDEYGYYIDSQREKALHIARISINDFAKAVSERSSTALAVLDEGVLLAGKIPMKLMSGRRFVLASEISMESRTKRRLGLNPDQLVITDE